MQELAQTAKQTRAWACYDCGKCTSTCPVSRAGRLYSPRRHVLAANMRDAGGIIENGSLHACLTCGLCDQRCPAEVSYSTLVQKLREHARGGNGAEPDCPHGGALQSIMRMMARGSTKQDRLAWLDDSFKTDPLQGGVFYWTGCAAYYDAFFTELGSRALDGVKAAVRILNKLDITPVVSPEERCCGHDLLWSGDRENFELLARHNVELVEQSGAETLVVSCAECLRTWKIDYEPFFTQRPPRIMHLTEFLAERLPDLKFTSQTKHRVTYQDPCRLGHHLKIYDAPRDILAALPNVELAEMRRARKSAICCAGGSWNSCDRYSKKIQAERLREARAVGAEFLITACPKCQIHFRCAAADPNLKNELEIKMRDIGEVVAGALGIEK